jgi:hypothetical protein
VSGERDKSNTAEEPSVAGPVSETTLAAVREASRNMEAEAEAMIQVEEAYRKANDTAAEVRKAIRSERAAKVRLSEARLGEKAAIADAKRAAGEEARADKELKRREEKLTAQLDKVAKAHEHGRTPKVTGRDQARRQFGEAEQRAIRVHSEADKVREALAASIEQLKAAEEEAKQAFAWIQTCRGIEAAAWGKVAHTEDDVRKAMLEARRALDMQSRAKKNMDMTIRSLKAVMRNEDRIARAAETGATAVKREHQAARSSVSGITERLVNKMNVLLHRPAATIRATKMSEPIKNGPGDAQKTGKPLGSVEESFEKQPDDQPSVELLDGTVRLLIMGPIDFSRIKKLRTSMERAGGCRVKSVGGSSGEGTSITVRTEEAVPLIERIKDLDFVEWVSRKGKDIEITLKPFADTVARQVRSEPRGHSPDTTKGAPVASGAP